MKINFKEQLQRNAVAIISLAIAITSLGYNTWRNEASEYNRNQRLVSIEVLRKISELQEFILYRNYEVDDELRGNTKTGWALVLTIKDLSQVLDAPVPASSTRLWEVWGTHFADLGQEDDDVDSYKEILNALEAVREDTHALLKSLD